MLKPGLESSVIQPKKTILPHLFFIGLAICQYLPCLMSNYVIVFACEAQLLKVLEVFAAHTFLFDPHSE